MRFLSRWLVLLAFATHFSAAAQSQPLSAIVNDYYAVYQQREDFDKFMSYYAKDAQVTDMISDTKLSGKEQIAAFFNWSAGDVTLIKPGPLMGIRAQHIVGNSVITRGVFHAFTYQGAALGPWEFIIWHEFNEDGKIVRQEDWITYPPELRLSSE